VSRAPALLAVALCAAAAQAGWWDDVGVAKPTTLAELRRDPAAWRDVVVSFDLRVVSVVEAGDPGLTRFSYNDWQALAVDAADAPLELTPWAKPYSLVFVRRGSEAERRVVGAKKPVLVQIRGAVRDVVRGEPWIEVFEATGDADPLTPEEEDVVARADEFFAHSNPAAAETLYRGLVAKRSLPKTVRADVLRKIGASCRAQRLLDKAVEALAASLALDPDDGATARQLAVLRAAISPTPTLTAPVQAAPAQSAPAVVVAAAPKRPTASAKSSEAPTAAKPAPDVRDPAPQTPTPTSTGTAMVESAPPASPPKPELAGPK
jgi:hypothetical protein